MRVRICKYQSLFFFYSLLQCILILFFSIPSSDAAESVTLQLKWSHQFQFAGYYAAIEKGYYAEEDLDVTLIEGKPGGNEIEDVISGRANFGVGNSGIILARLKGKPVVVLANIFQHSSSVLLTIKDSGISSPQDLFGQKVMMASGFRAAELQTMFVNEGIPVDSLTILKPSGNLDDLINGKCAAMAAYISSAPYYLEKKNIPYTIISPISYGIDFYGDNLFTSEQEITQHPNRVIAFRKASLKGWQYAIEHPKEIIDIILLKYATGRKYITKEFLVHEASSYQRLILPKFVKIGHINPGRWKHIADTYVKLDMADKDYSLEGFFYEPTLTKFDWGHWAIKWGIGVGIISFGCIVFLIFFNRRLNREIYERKQVEEEIRRSKKEWEDTFNAISDWVCIIDTETHQILKSNSAVEEFLEVPSTDVIGQVCWNLVHGLDEPISGCPLKKMIQTHKRESMELKGPKTNQWISITVDPVKNEEGETTGAVHIVRNITERKRLELQLLQSEKLASVGQLAAGVAHEINNPTGFVSSNLTTFKDYLADITRLLRLYHKLIAELRDTIAKEDMPSSIEKQVEQIIALKTEVDIDFILNDVMKLIAESREGTERIRKIVLDLKDFAHPGEDKLRFADINKGLDSTLNVVWNELKYKATVTKDYGDLPEVRCYPQQLNQVFANLLINAAQAIEKKGEIKMATRAIEGKVEICISDTGAGIPKEVLPKIFDSFFTTKDVGKGTGMGLNIAYNIIKKNKGTMEVQSTVGEGTTFTIRIPIAEAEE